MRSPRDDAAREERRKVLDWNVGMVDALLRRRLFEWAALLLEVRRVYCVGVHLLSPLALTSKGLAALRIALGQPGLAGLGGSFN